MVGAEMVKGGWGRNMLVELAEMIQKRDRKETLKESRYGFDLI
jgi:hypothetical protein